MTTPTLPSYAKILFSGYSQQRASALLRTEMDSGPPKQAKIRSRVMVTRSCTLQFLTLEDFQSFEDWYANDLGEGSAWFHFPDPVGGSTKLARFVDGGYNATPMMGGLKVWQIDAKIESWGG